MGFRELALWPLATLGPKVMSLKTAFFDVGEFKIMQVNLAVFSAYAPLTGALQVDLEHSADSKDWYHLASFSAVSPPLTVVPTGQTLHVEQFLRYVRVSISILGTTDPILFTFSLNGIAKDGQ